MIMNEIEKLIDEEKLVPVMVPKTNWIGKGLIIVELIYDIISYQISNFFKKLIIKLKTKGEKDN